MKLNVSLYIPVYNGESTIESVLKSALKLSPAPNEIIVVNGGGKNDCKIILENWKNSFKNLKIIETENINYFYFFSINSIFFIFYYF